MSESEGMVNPFYYCDISVDKSNIALLREMGADGRISADHFSIKDSVAKTVLNEHEIDMLTKMGFVIKVKQNMMDRAMETRSEVLESRSMMESDNLLSNIVDRYLDVEGIIQKYTTLQREFSNMSEIIDLPNKTSGYDGSKVNLRGPSAVKLFHIDTNRSKPKPGLLLITGTHAREWVPPLAGIVFVEHLLRSVNSNSTSQPIQEAKKILDGVELLIVPAMNPDGINYSHHDNVGWRKNRNPSNPNRNCRGVDNNRNYSTHWGEAGSSPDQCNDSFKGVSALSEPENKNIDHILKAHRNIITAVDCHSFGEDIFRPQPTGGAFITSQPVTQEDQATYLRLESSMNSAISSITPGKSYDTGTTNNHAGTSDDYFYFAHHVFGFCVECVSDEFQPPITTAITTAKEVSAALRALAIETLVLDRKISRPTQ